jgi:hypothetical protein
VIRSDEGDKSIGDCKFLSVHNVSYEQFLDQAQSRYSYHSAQHLMIVHPRYRTPTVLLSISVTSNVLSVGFLDIPDLYKFLNSVNCKRCYSFMCY